MKWTKEMVDILVRNYQTDGPSKLAKELETTHWAVTAKARRLGIGATRKKPPDGFEWTEDMLTSIRDQYVLEGGKKLSKKFGLSIDTVRRKASSMGLHTIIGHAIAGEDRAKNCSSWNLSYFDEWNPRMSYILGFLFADGSVDKRLVSIRIQIASKDESILDFIRKELNPKAKIYRFDGRLDRRTGNVNQPQSRFSINSTVIVRKLINLGLKWRKTYNDDSFPKVPDEMMAHFIRGYLDGDGCVCVSSNGYCSISFVGSPKFISDLRNNLVRILGVRTSTIQIRGSDVKWSTVCWNSLEDLRLLRDFLYPKGFGFCLDRKRSKLVEWLGNEIRYRSHLFGTPAGSFCANN